jgi:hypothetical protein
MDDTTPELSEGRRLQLVEYLQYRVTQLADLVERRQQSARSSAAMELWPAAAQDMTEAALADAGRRELQRVLDVLR